MSFSLAAPLALGLGLLVLGPLLAHMTLRTPRERLAYGAMMLVQRLARRLRKRRRVMDPWLLALRMLAVGLLAFAATRPQLAWPGDPPDVGGSGRMVLLVDDSMSMALVQDGAPLFERARDQALGLLREAPPGTQVGLVTLGGRAEAVSSELSDEVGLIRARLEALQPGHGSTDLSGGLHLARSLLDGEPGEVVIFTDEAGPNVVAAAEAELAALIEQDARIVPRPIPADPPANVAVVGATYGDGLEGGTVSVEVANFGPRAQEVPLSLELPDGSTITAFVEVPPGNTATEELTIPPEVPGGIGRVQLDDPALPRDDVRWFHLPRVGAARVLVVDGDPGASAIRSEIYFLERALAPFGGQGVMPEVTSSPELTSLDPERHKVVFLANVSDPRAAAEPLVDFVRQGGGLVLAMGDNVTAERYNEALRELLPAQLRKKRDLVALTDERGVPLELPDVKVPLFSTFTRAGRGGFPRIRTRRAMTLEPFEETDDVSVLLRFADGNPALVERRVGRGRVLLWTTSIDRDWSTAPVEAVFMPLIQRMVSELGGEAVGGAIRGTGTVGDVVELELKGVEREPRLTSPAGMPMSLEGERTADGWRLRFTPWQPGAWTVGDEGAPAQALVAVNVPPAESDVRVYDRLEALGRALDAERFVQRAELGPWALWLALLLFVLQGWWATRPREVT